MGYEPGNDDDMDSWDEIEVEQDDRNKDFEKAKKSAINFSKTRSRLDDKESNE
jgi:hypothetical protein